MHDWLQDVRVILRGWRRTPGFSATIVLTLVLSLGLASAVFAFADGYLFRRALFPGADQLYRVRDPGDKTYGLLKASDQIALRNSALASWGFVAFDSSDRLEGIAEIDGRRFDITSYEVSPGFQSTVRLPLLAGRDFTPADHAPGEPVPVWLSHRFWKSAFHGDLAALNQTYKVLGPFDKPIAIVVAGILGPDVTSFDGNNRPPEVIVPSTEYMASGPNLLADPIVRLPDGVTPEQAAARIAAVLQSAAPARDGVTRSPRLRSFQQSQVAGGAPTARVLFAGALLVVLLAGINLIHLLLARGAARSAEVATRAALGASRWRLVRFFLTESLLLGAAGISAGLLLGSGLASLIAESIPDYPTRGRNMAMIAMQFDARVMAFAIVLGVVLSLAGGLWPAWRAVRRSLAVTTRVSSGMTDAVSSRLSRLLLSSELAVATIVMIGTLFIGLGIWRYLNQPLGFDTGDRFTVSLQMPIVIAFGGLAFLLAGVGVFGLVSYLVERRQREFGIRLALGAKPADICRSVFRLSVVPALAGLAVGGASAWALESVVRSSVFGWQSSGLGAFVLTSAALLAVAVIASLSPARRAMRVDPAVTLRAE